MSLTQIGSLDGAFETVQNRASDVPAECRAWWDNGLPDFVSGLNSQELVVPHASFQALVADDFFLKFGKCYWIESIELDMAIFGVVDPVVALRIYDDCNGRPAALAWPEFTNPAVTNLGQLGGALAGFTHYRFRFSIDLFEYGYRRLWVNPVGIGKGLYYWLTSNNGVVQGVQGQYQAAAFGFPSWTDVDQTGTNFGICTDFNFRVCGKCCWLLKDNSDFDTSGLSSIAFANGIIFGSRAVDNFQVPPGKDIEVCRIEAWMATNCDVTRAFMEIYNNDCDSPVKPASITLTGADVMPLYSVPPSEGIPGIPLTFDGLPVYKFSFTCPGVVLQGGQNYWLAMATIGVGTPFERATWLFKRKSECHINITQGQYKNIFLAGFQDFTQVEHPGLAGEPRDFAFRLYAAEPEAGETTPPPASEPTVGDGGGAKDIEVPTAAFESEIE
ncbi:MAG TPA: hypothetical protein DEB06_06680 [Phycisphaerales bacterium]|nr:hypothetical protein [Phycisphaerales bacterium]